MFPKVKKRKISVNNTDYFWAVSGNDGWIDLYVMTDSPNDSKMLCKFCYHQDEKPIERNGDAGVSLKNQFVVTPYIVRQAIEFGLKNGWTPSRQGKDKDFGHIDDKIDLRLHNDRSS